MNEATPTRTIFGIVIASVLLAFAVGGGIGYWGRTHLSTDSQRWFETLSLLVGQGIIILPAVYFLRTRRLSLITAFRLKPISRQALVAAVGLAIGIIIWVDELDRLLSLVIVPPDYLEQLAGQMRFEGTLLSALLWITIVFIAPIGEELLFRGFLQRFLERTWGDVTRAILVTSMVFAMVHLNPFWLIQIYVLGVFLGYLAWRTQSIIPGLVLHIFNNSLALVLSQDSMAGFESIYTFHGHVSPPWLILGGISLYLGFKQLPEATEAAL